MGQLLRFAHVAVQVHAQPAVALERVEGADVGHRHRRVVVVAVAGGEGLRVEREAARALLLAEFIGKCGAELVLPLLRDAHDQRLELLGVVVGARVRAQAHHEVGAHQH